MLLKVRWIAARSSGGLGDVTALSSGFGCGHMHESTGSTRIAIWNSSDILISLNSKLRRPLRANQNLGKRQFGWRLEHLYHPPPRHSSDPEYFLYSSITNGWATIIEREIAGKCGNKLFQEWNVLLVVAQWNFLY